MQEAVGVLIAFATSALTTCFLAALLRWLGDDKADTNGGSNWRSVLASFSVSVSIALAFFVSTSWLLGKVALPDPATAKFWHWLAPMGVVVAFVASPLTKLKSVWRYAAWLLIGLVAAYFLVPTWGSLVPTRNVYIPLLGLTITCLIASYELVNDVTTPREQITMLFVTGAGIAVSCAAVVSLKFGLLAAYVSLALTGALVASYFVKLKSMTVQGGIPTATVLIASTAFFGFVYPENPIPELAMLPWAPCAAFAWNRGWKTRLSVVIATVVGLVAVLWMRFEGLA